MTTAKAARRLLYALGLIAGLVPATPSWAVPSYARQTGQDCVACHIGGFGPQLTPYGIKFKLGGYTETDGKDGKVPLSAMVVASFDHTKKAQAEPPADGKKTNDNTSLDEASLFLAGKLATDLGSFLQVTYDGIGKSTSIDQMDLRYAHATTLYGKDVTFGVSFNNNPGVQDPFNTLPVWGYPYTGTELGFGGPEAGTLINGGLEQHVLGLSGYAFVDDHWYAELGSYRTLSPTMQTRLGLGREDDPGHLGANTAYWRLAYMNDMHKQAWSAGLFGFNTSVQPDRQGGPSNRYRDIGIDGSYQFLGTREHILTVQGSYIREHADLQALAAAGEADQASNRLNEFKLNASYYYQQTYGISLGHFRTTGSADASLYADSPNHTPDTSGNTLQLDWTPFGKETSWGAPWANLRLGAQYTWFQRYNGASSNYDGTGRSASDNNTLYVFAWTAF